MARNLTRRFVRTITAPRPSGPVVVPLSPGHAVGQSPSGRMRGSLALASTGRDVTLQYVDANNRYIWTPLFGPYWARWSATVASTGFWYVYGLAVYHVLHGIPATDANISAVSSAWSTTVGSGYFGGAFRAKGTGWMEFTFTGGSNLWLVNPRLTGGGFLAVTINGSKELANELPEVDGERRVSCYADAATQRGGFRTLIASGLNPSQTYTVRLTVSAALGGGGGHTGYVEGWGTEAESMNDGVVGTIANDQVLVRTLGSKTGSYWEYAYWLRPAGATTFEVGGTGHLNENITGTTWTDGEGNDIAVDDITTRRNAPVINLTNVGTTRHPESGATDLAALLSRASFHTDGLDIYHRHDWLTDVDGGQAYAAMFTMDSASFTKGQVAGDAGQAYDLTVGGDVFHGMLASQCAAFWQPGTPWVPFLYLPDLTGVNSYVNTTLRLSIDDRSQVGVGLVKIYANRNGGRGQDVTYEALHAGDVWESTAHYRVGYLPDPSAVLPL